MKAKSFYPLILACILGLMAGCSSKAAKEANMGKDYKGAPNWVFTPDSEGSFSAVGSATIGKAGFAFARNEAMADARDQLARRINVKVQNIAKNFVQVTGIGNDEVVDRVVSNASRQIANTDLAGSTMRTMWRSDNDELFVLVDLDPESVKAIAKEAVVSSYKNDSVLWQQFQAKEAFNELDEILENDLDE